MSFGWGDKGEYMTNPQHLVDMLSCLQPRTLLLVLSVFALSLHWLYFFWWWFVFLKMLKCP